MTPQSLLTVADHVALLVNGLHPDRDNPPVCKLFMPGGAGTWLLAESDPDEPNHIFALCDTGSGCPELGWCNLEEITALRGKLGLPVERDQTFVADKPLSAYAEEARTAGRITV